MTHRRRKLLAILVLVVVMPAWIVLATVITSALERPHVLVEIAIYVGLGVAWVLPFRRLFLGIGRADPEKRGD